MQKETQQKITLRYRQSVVGDSCAECNFRFYLAKLNAMLESQIVFPDLFQKKNLVIVDLVVVLKAFQNDTDTKTVVND